MKRKQFKKKSSFSNSSKTLQFGKKSCPLAKKNIEELNYKNIKLLKKFISDSAKILPSRITNVSYGKQKILVREIKKARALALLPYVEN